MNWLLLQSPNPHSHLSSRYWIKVVWSLVITYWGSLFGFILDQRSLWLNFSGSSNFFFRCEEVHLFLLHYSLIFLDGNPDYNVCLLLPKIGRMWIHVWWTTLPVRVELHEANKTLVLFWECSSYIVVNLLCHTCILLCLPVDVFLNAIKRKQKSSTEEKGFFSVSLFTCEEKTVDLCNSVRQRKAVYYHRGY